MWVGTQALNKGSLASLKGFFSCYFCLFCFYFWGLGLWHCTCEATLPSSWISNYDKICFALFFLHWTSKYLEETSVCLWRASNWLYGPIGSELKMLETAHVENHEFHKYSGCFLVAFPYYGKYLRWINLRWGKFILVHDFRSFDPWSLDYIVVGHSSKAWHYGSKEIAGREKRDNIPFKAIPSMT